MIERTVVEGAEFNPNEHRILPDRPRKLKERKEMFPGGLRVGKQK
jgi:hypothetical protein